VENRSYAGLLPAFEETDDGGAREQLNHALHNFSSLGGTDDMSRISPFRGSFKRFYITFSKLLEVLRTERSLAKYAGFLVVAAAGLGSALVLSGFEVVSPLTVLALSAAAAVAERGTVRLSSHVEVSIALLPTLFAAVVFGPLAAMLVCVCSMLADFRSPYLKWTIYSASRSITGGIAGIAAAQASSLSSDQIGAIALGTLAGAMTIEVLDLTFVLVTLKLRRAEALGDAARTLGAVAVAALPLQAPVVAMLAYVYEDISPWTLPLFLIPAMAAQRLSIMYQEQRRLADDLGSANARLERASVSFATALVTTLDARDRYTAGHSAAVAVYARDIAARLDLTPDEQQLAHLCGLVHDIGKVGLPLGLFEKPGPLTLEERRQMEEHSIIGERILSKVEGYSDVAVVVRHHHERVDGNGYPDGLMEDEIPLLARIISVADAYNAMTSDRPYRDAMPSRVARLRLAQAVESQFDTNIVAAFEAILAGAPETYRVGTGGIFNLARREYFDQPGTELPRLRAAAH
jgi:putative nucleotidyltransferase with HDIG domain